MKCSLGISNFLEEISSLSHSIVFLCFFALITEEGFLISPWYSLELCVQMGISFLFSFAFHFSSQLFVRPPQRTILPFYISFSREWCWSLPPEHCHKLLSIVLRTLCLSEIIPECLSLPLYNRKGFDLGHTWMTSTVFPTFLNWSLNMAIRSSSSEPQSASGLVFADCIELPEKLWLGADCIKLQHFQWLILNDLIILLNIWL